MFLNHQNYKLEKPNDLPLLSYILKETSSKIVHKNLKIKLKKNTFGFLLWLITQLFNTLDVIQAILFACHHTQSIGNHIPKDFGRRDCKDSHVSTCCA